MTFISHTTTRSAALGLSLASLLALAPVAYADTASASLNLAPASSMITQLLGFISGILVPLVFGIAFIVFIWGVFQYFIAGGANEEARDKGKQLVVYGLIGFFIMIAVWGLVGLLLRTFGLSGGGTRPDLPTFGAPSSSGTTGSTGSFGGTGAPSGSAGGTGSTGGTVAPAAPGGKVVDPNYNLPPVPPQYGPQP